MRILVLAAVPAILFGQATGVVEGTVTNRVTHGGIEGVEVMVQSVASQNGPNYTGTTDAAGAFHVEGVPDGEYRANFGKPGFVPGDISLMPPPAPFRVTAADGPVRLQLTLVPVPRLRGRVVDSEGHPIPDAAVQLVHPGGGGRPEAKTGKDGAFELGQLLPAAFMIRAIPPPKLPPPKSKEDEPEIWAPTYYPGVTEQFRAERLVIRAGQERDDCEIVLRAVPVFHVRGRVVDDGGNPVAGATIKLVSPDSLDARSHAIFEEPEGHATSADDGAFDFARVRPGEWFLMASGKKGGRSLSGVVTGTVSQGDWENVKIRVTVPFTVRGTVERPDARIASTRHTWVGLIPGWQTRLMGIHDQSGALEIDDVLPGKYQILLEEPLPGSYLDTVQYGGRDVLGQTVDVTDGSLRLRVVYRTNGGRVQGPVEDCGRGMVVLVPMELALQNSEMIRWGRCNAAGRFDIGDLRPGGYYAAAFDRMNDLELYYGAVVDPALIAKIIEHAAGVAVEAGQTTPLALKLTPWPDQ
ncbi:MAG: carboxypeptidase-like regulatory domain-containing protein [Candidatus Sulfopaludibacter sp.]|nr:carboxypeptidase-like regulatory domain-containing protein [Candidatus Sulfopaludibacter sp.]